MAIEGDSGQNPPEKTSIRYCINIATYNVRTLKDPERLVELENALQDIRWEIIGISEMRKMGENIEEHKNYIQFYKGETQGSHGVGFLVKKELAKDIIEFEGVSERIAVLNINLHNQKDPWTIIQAYAPTEQAKEQNTIKFYEELNNTVKRAKGNLIVMGDFNGRTGKRKTGEEEIIGKFSYGERSQNGEKLVNFASENKLRIMNSYFKKRPAQKWTWQHPNGTTFNEIDFIMTNRHKNISNIEIINNLNFYTDHRMVRATISGKQLKRSRRSFGKDITNVQYMNMDTLVNSLQYTLKAKQEDYLSVQQKYDQFISAVSETVQKTSNTANKISDRARELLEERKLLFQNKQNQETKKQIAKISKELNQQLRKDRKEKRRVTFTKHIERTGGIKKATKELEEQKGWIPYLKQNEKLIKKRPEIIKVATEYYRKLYSKKGRIDKTIVEALEGEEETIPKILQSETERAIISQRNDKAPGEDSITNELLKGAIPALAPALTELFNIVLETEEIPKQWTESVITLLYKKGDNKDINNYRPISLMTNIYKVFSKILLSRISRKLDENQSKDQAGFRRNFCTLDHIHVVKQVIEKFNEFNDIYYLCFIDYSKAFDSLNHESIWEALLMQGIEKKYIRILRNIYTKCSAKIRLDRVGEPFRIECGVRQGDPISPKMFTAVLEQVFRKMDWARFGLNIDGERLTNLRFADDIVLFAKNPDDLKEMIQQLAHESREVGLQINHSKTKIITNSTEIGVTLEGKNIEYVKEYIYLGQIISSKEDTNKEIDRRICNTWKRFWSLKEIMKNKKIAIKEKRKVFEMCLSPCLTYGCQTWPLTKKNLNKLRVCQNSIERSVLGIKLQDKIKLEQIKEETNFKDILKTIWKQKWSWTGHAMRNKEHKWTRIITTWYPRDRKRKKGRPLKRWEDDIRGAAGGLWIRHSMNRNEWRALEEVFVTGQLEGDGCRS